MELSGKVAWVVGGSSGIGAAVARELQSRGAVVAITARRRGHLDEVSDGAMLAVAADVTDAASLTAAAARIRDELGPIDLAVLSAGYWKQLTATDWDTETFNQHVEVNLIGMSNSIAEVLPQMLARRRGVIAGISSAAGYRGWPDLRPMARPRRARSTCSSRCASASRAGACAPSPSARAS
jgi:NADP-dependent 3-hydroxy acid dehydrogenase YdfG